MNLTKSKNWGDILDDTVIQSIEDLSSEIKLAHQDNNAKLFIGESTNFESFIAELKQRIGLKKMLRKKVKAKELTKAVAKEVLGSRILKKCPACAEYVGNVHVKCPHCNAKLAA